MLLVGMNSWIQSSTGAVGCSSELQQSQPKRHLATVRAGFAIALVALALVVGMAQPSGAGAYKSDSIVCTTLEAGFNYASDMALAAQRAGDTKTANYWIKISLGLQSTYLDVNCSYSFYEGPAA